MRCKHECKAHLTLTTTLRCKHACKAHMIHMTLATILRCKHAHMTLTTFLRCKHECKAHMTDAEWDAKWRWSLSQQGLVKVSRRRVVKVTSVWLAM